MTSLRFAHFTACAFVTSCALVFTASAQAAPVKAGNSAAVASSLKAGEAKLNAGDAAGALVEFQAADAASPTSTTAHFVARAEDRLEHFRQAVAAYERYAESAPPSEAAEVAIVKARIAEIEAMPATVHVTTTPAGAAISVDGATESQPSPVDLKLAPGRHVVRATNPGYEAFEREIELNYAGARNVQLDMIAAPPASLASSAPVVAPPPAPVDLPPPAPDEPWLTRAKVGYIAAGLAVVGVGFGTAFGIAALDDKSSFDKHPTVSTGNDGNDYAVASDVAFGAAVAMATTSLVLLFTSPDAKPASSSPPPVAARFSASPLFMPHGAGAGALVRF